MADKDLIKNVMETGHGPPSTVTGDQRGSKGAGETGHGPPSLTDPLKGSKTDDFPSVKDPNKIINEQSMEILRLRSELSLSSAKIKGYQTLSHLFQESKQECSRYKQRSEQLQQQLESHLSRCSVDSIVTNPTQLELSSIVPSPQRSSLAASRDSTVDLLSSSSVATVVNRDEKHSEMAGKNAGTGEENLEAGGGSKKSDDSPGNDHVGKIQSPDNDNSNKETSLNASGGTGGGGMGWTIVGEQKGMVGGKKEDKAGGDRSSSASGATSPSFIQLSGSDLESNGSESRKRSLQHEMVGFSEEGNLAAEVRELSGHLGDPSLSPESRAFAAEIIHIGVKAMKITRVKQVLLEQKDIEMRNLEIENQLLRAALQERSGQHLEGGSQQKLANPSDEIGPRSGGENFGSMKEWVRVQKGRERGEDDGGRTAGGPGPGDPVAVSMSVQERDHRAEVIRLEADIRQQSEYSRWLVEDVNRTRQQIVALEEERRKLIFEQEQSERRRVEDSIALHTTVQQLEEEKRKRTEAEQQCIELKQRTLQLEKEMETLSKSQLEPVDAYFLKSEDHAVSAAPPSLLESELRTQLLLLRQQVTVFKDDFDQERKDREKAKAETEECKKEISLLKTQLKIADEKLQLAHTNLKAVHSENKLLKIYFDKNPIPSMILKPQNVVSPPAQAIRTLSPSQSSIRQPERMHYSHETDPSNWNVQHTQSPTRFPERVVYPEDQSAYSRTSMQQFQSQARYPPETAANYAADPSAASRPLQQHQSPTRQPDFRVHFAPEPGRHGGTMVGGMPAAGVYMQQARALPGMSEWNVPEQSYLGMMPSVERPQLVFNTYRPEVEARTWACQVCTYDNPEQRNHCEICGVLKQNMPAPLVPRCAHGGTGVYQCDVCDVNPIGSQKTFSNRGPSPTGRMSTNDIEVDKSPPEIPRPQQ